MRQEGFEMTVQICCNCDGVIKDNLFHSCIRGLTENINRLHSNMNLLMKEKSDYGDGLIYALKIIDGVEEHYKAMDITYNEENFDPFHDIKNKIRMHLGLPFVNRRL